MRTIFVILAIIGLAVSPAFASGDKLAKSVEMWSPISVTTNSKVATIILPQKRITDTIYESVINSGVCFGLLAEPSALDAVDEIVILNQHKRQGYVFEGGKELCETLNEMPLGKSKKLMLLGHTRFH